MHQGGNFHGFKKKGANKFGIPEESHPCWRFSNGVQFPDIKKSLTVLSSWALLG
jgi:hypothetical protein